MKDVFSGLLMDAIRFEQWLRFYYMEDGSGSKRDIEGAEAFSARDPEAGQGNAVLCIPADVLQRIADEMPGFAPLAYALNGSVISAGSSRICIFAYLRERFGLGESEFGDSILKSIEDPDFRRALDAFHGYVQYLADNENDENASFFNEWMERFDAWAKEHDIPFINSVSKYRPEMDAFRHPELLGPADGASEQEPA
ncbi:MAG: hypothetical protein J5855_08460 [Mailhella sp.]|nr:hypothetical protein [Mailhella sp.]